MSFFEAKLKLPTWQFQVLLVAAVLAFGMRPPCAGGSVGTGFNLDTLRGHSAIPAGQGVGDFVRG